MSLKIDLINIWADFARQYNWVIYPRAKHSEKFGQVFIERLICPILKHEWKLNSGNGVFCLRCRYYARTKDLNIT